MGSKNGRVGLYIHRCRGQIPPTYQRRGRQREAACGCAFCGSALLSRTRAQGVAWMIDAYAGGDRSLVSGIVDAMHACLGGRVLYFAWLFPERRVEEDEGELPAGLARVDRLAQCIL